MTQALLMIDIQNDYFPGGNMTLDGIEQAADNARDLLLDFRSRSAPTVHIQHVSRRPGSTFFLPDTDGVEINQRVAPETGEKVIEKQFPNSFRDTPLLEHLQNDGIDELVICGAMTHMCIDASTRAAFDLGLRCIVVKDACATKDLQYEDQTVEAAKVHAAFLAALAVPYAQLISSKEFGRTK